MLKATEIKENALQSQRLEGKMLKEHHHKVIKELHTKGIAKREIARTLGLDIKTVRRYLKRPNHERKRLSVSLGGFTHIP